MKNKLKHCNLNSHVRFDIDNDEDEDDGLTDCSYLARTYCSDDLFVLFCYFV